MGGERPLAAQGQQKTNFQTICVKGLRRWLKAPFRKGVGSNPTAVICSSSRRAWGRQGFYKAVTKHLQGDCEDIQMFYTVFLYKVLTRLLRSWFIMFYKKLRFVFGRCFTRLLYGFYVFYGFFTRIWAGYYKAFARFLHSFHTAFTKLFKFFSQGFHTFVCGVFYKASTMFFTRLLQCFGKDFTRCFPWFFEDCTRLVIAFHKVCARLLPNLMPCADRRAASSCEARQFGRAVWGGGSRRHSARAWVRTPQLSLLEFIHSLGCRNLNSWSNIEISAGSFKFIVCLIPYCV